MLLTMIFVIINNYFIKHNNIVIVKLSLLNSVLCYQTNYNASS